MLNPKITKGQTKSYILTVTPATTVHVTDRMGKVTLEKLSNVAEFPGQVGEGSGWKCVGSEEGKVVCIPFEGYYESKGGRIESPRFKLDGEIGKNRFYRLTFSAKCPDSRGVFQGRQELMWILRDARFTELPAISTL